MNIKKLRVTKSFDIAPQIPKKHLSTGQKENKNTILLAKFTNVGYYLIFPILAGLFLGLTLDNFFNLRPVFTILFLIAGTIAAFYNLFNLTKK